MFQSFDQTADPSVGPARLEALRAELRRLDVDGFIVPRSDAHQGEYVPANAERLAWLSGFTGSAGVAIVLADRAVLLVDGRYTLQAREQTDPGVFEIASVIETPLSEWLGGNLQTGNRLGLDPWLHTVSGFRKISKACEKVGATGVPLTDNPIDAIWTDRPDPPMGQVVRHSLENSGISAKQKLADIAESVAAHPADVFVFTQPDSIAWLFNIRGNDIPHIPAPLGYATLTDKGTAQLFCDAAKLSDAVRAELEEICSVHPPRAFAGELVTLGEAGRRVMLDLNWTSEAIRDAVESAGGTVVSGDDPVRLPKAIKNDAEMAGARAAHIRDGKAVIQFLAWLDREAPGGSVDEISAARKLEELRAGTGKLKDISFDTISGAGPNGAIVHYRVTHATNSKLESGSLYLVDSGAQFVDGTTDITRTVAIGTPSEEMRNRFTLVLKGHIALSLARFPAGTSGTQLDSLARIALWKAGLDFDHGTGHGVGSYLSVHEGPQRISKAGNVPLEAGMIVSNEPGYYREGAFGIRIENLEMVHAPELIAGGERPMLGFETLTVVPIDQRLVVPDLMNREEANWLNAYHLRIRDLFLDDLDGEDRAWLGVATEPIECDR